MGRKGELSAVAIDRGWPHQVVVPARLCERDGYNEIHDFCRGLTLCSRSHALYHDGQWFHRGSNGKGLSGRTCAEHHHHLRSKPHRL